MQVTFQNKSVYNVDMAIETFYLFLYLFSENLRVSKTSSIGNEKLCRLQTVRLGIHFTALLFVELFSLELHLIYLDHRQPKTYLLCLPFDCSAHGPETTPFKLNAFQVRHLIYNLHDTPDIYFCHCRCSALI